MAAWRGYYINLDRSTERRANMETRLASAGLARRYERFSAVDGAVVGPTKVLRAPIHACFRSHRDAIAAHGGREFVHIVEDDTIFSAGMEKAIDTTIATNVLADADLVFLYVIVAAEVATLRKMKLDYDEALRAKRCQLFDLRGFPFSGAASYLVNPASVPKIVRALDDEIARGPSLPVDLFFRREVHAGRLGAKCFLPFLTSTDRTASTIDAVANPGIELLVEQSRSFYVDADHAEGLRRVEELVRRAPEDEHLALVGAIQRLLLSERLGDM